MSEFTSEQKREAFLLRAGFSHGWENLESVARRMVDQSIKEMDAVLERQAQWPSDEDIESAVSSLENYVDDNKCGLTGEMTIADWQTAMRAALEAVAPVQAAEPPAQPTKLEDAVREVRDLLRFYAGPDDLRMDRADRIKMADKLSRAIGDKP